MDATDADGRTALWLAVRAGQAGLLGALLSAGASPSRADGGGLPPLWVACAMCQRGLALQVAWPCHAVTLTLTLTLTLAIRLTRTLTLTLSPSPTLTLTLALAR